MEPEPTPSTFDGVIVPEDTLDQWTTLSNRHPLSQLRNKSWGYSMKDEEDEWRRHHWHPEDERMKVDDGDEDMENEIDQGCYALDFDYMRIYDFCETFYNDVESFDSGIAPSVIITGQPRIGKTYWIRYALRRRLAEGKPIIWYRKNRCYLFAEDGVFLSPSDLSATEFRTFVWTLADSDDNFPSHLAKQDTRHFIMYTTSPRQERWKPLEKTTHSAVLIMNPWTREEIFQAAPLHGLDATYHDRINKLYDDIGPTARICFDFLKNPYQLITHKSDYDGVISSLTVEQLRHLVLGGTELNLDATSHSIFLVKREDVKDLTHASVEPISTLVKSDLLKRIQAVKPGEQIRLYEYLSAVAGSRPMAGLVFESLAQSKLQTNAVLELIPMVKRTSDESTNSSQGDRGRWHSNHGGGEDNFPGDTQTTKRRRTAALWTRLDSDHCVKFSLKKTVVYEGSELKVIQPSTFYVRKSTNQVAFDSFIMEDGHLYIFQFTIALTHSIKKGIVSFFSQPSLPPRTKWHFIFVIPPGSKISCPQPRNPELNELLTEMKLFSAELDPTI
ncbi:hypothetical protein BJV78DRAFT_1358290 [Lactifluus subvellereus]|nr:hypothetical protein BJV78DRAFT_1358290 [Lactifluus subvellereus]